MKKPKFVLEIDLKAPIQLNLNFLNRCEAAIKEKREILKCLRKKAKTSNQIDLEDLIKQETNKDTDTEWNRR